MLGSEANVHGRDGRNLRDVVVTLDRTPSAGSEPIAMQQTKGRHRSTPAFRLPASECLQVARHRHVRMRL